MMSRTSGATPNPMAFSSSTLPLSCCPTATLFCSTLLSPPVHDIAVVAVMSDSMSAIMHGGLLCVCMCLWTVGSSVQYLDPLSAKSACSCNCAHVGWSPCFVHVHLHLASPLVPFHSTDCRMKTVEPNQQQLSSMHALHELSRCVHYGNPNGLHMQLASIDAFPASFKHTLNCAYSCLLSDAK